MREEQRAIARRKLDKELRYYRLAANQENATEGLLRVIRQVMGFPMAEIAGELSVNRSVVFRLEQSEIQGTISLNNMDRVANAMGFVLVYAIVPLDGETLEQMADRRMWEKLLGKIEIRDQ